MPDGLPQRVMGADVCPECKGKRVFYYSVSAPLMDSKHRYSESKVMFDAEDRPYTWCETCGGMGTASAALERAFLK